MQKWELQSRGDIFFCHLDRLESQFLLLGLFQGYSPHE